MNEPFPLKKFLLPAEKPFVTDTSFIASGAVVVGAVHLEHHSSIWFSAVLRGDINHIYVGESSNIQDGAVVHVSDAFPAIIGQRVTVGHRAIVHACTVGDEVLIGMGAILLDGCEIGPRCTIAAGALVPKGMIVPEGSLVIGTPGKIVRTLSRNEQQANAQLAAKYVEIARRYRDQGFHSGPLLPPTK